MASRDELPPDALEDCFGPPDEACECYCLHCQRVVNSADMWYQRVANAPVGHGGGFWMCPTANCDGAGFGFDLHPTDPDHPENAGWTYDDEDESEFDADEVADDGDAEYDPAEPQYADGAFDEDDFEGEEWKRGLQPGETPPESEGARAAREQWEAEQRRYDEPDRRPRTIDGSDLPPMSPPANRDAFGEITDDDIPF